MRDKGSAREKETEALGAWLVRVKAELEETPAERRARIKRETAAAREADIIAWARDRRRFKINLVKFL